MVPRGSRDGRALWPAAALLAIFVLAALWTLWFAAKVTEPFIWPDELTYAKEAIRIWDVHRFLLPSDPVFNSWAQLQPVAMAPFWGTMSSQDAYHATHVLNSIALASTAFPAYLLTRRITESRWAAVAVAALAVITPWVTLAGTLMTEVIAYPVFAWTLLALQRAVARPSWRAELLALLVLVFAFFTRTQFLALGPAYLVAIVVQELRFREGSLKDVARRHALLIAAGVVALLILAVYGAESPNVFGNYSRTTSGGLFPAGTFTQAVEGLAYVAVAIAILPVALSLSYAFEQVAKPEDRERHAYSVLFLATLGFLLYVTGVFSARFTAGVQDRYFYFLVVPLLVGTAGWLTTRRPSAFALGAGTLIAAWIVWRSALSLRSPSLVSPSATWHVVVFGKVSELNHRLGTQWLHAQRLMAVLTVLGCAALFAARRLRPQWRWVAVTALCAVGVYTAVETRYTMTHIAVHEQKRDAASWAGLDWIDDVVPGKGEIPGLLSDMGSPGDAEAIWWDARFWNKQLSPVRTFDDRYLAQGAVDNATLDRKRGRIAELAGTRYVVHAVPDRRFQLQGAKALGQKNSLEVLQLPGSGRVDWSLAAATDSGVLPVKDPATLRVYGPQRVTLSMTTNFQAAGNYRYRIAGPGVKRSGLIEVGQAKTETFDVKPPAGGYADIKLSAAGPVHPDYPLGGLAITDLHSTPAS